VPGRLGLYVPVSPDDLLAAIDEEAERQAEERLPYYGTLWPAGEALAHHLLPETSKTSKTSKTLEGVHVLDLGCGLGVVGLAAARQGARVTFVDWEERGLELVRASAQAQGLVPEALVVADWRARGTIGLFGRIFAADVLYEVRNVAAVAGFLARHLEPGGEAWLADPGRVPAERFEAALGGAGLELRSKAPLSYRPRGIQVDLFCVGVIPEVA
jgi:2-polyprenyl-3-methyl-5-hydroxy-6-metoxy-1,4-benzoquinol methylase